MSEYRPKEGTFNLGAVRIAVITALEYTGYGWIAHGSYSRIK